MNINFKDYIIKAAKTEPKLDVIVLEDNRAILLNRSIARCQAKTPFTLHIQIWITSEYLNINAYLLIENPLKDFNVISYPTNVADIHIKGRTQVIPPVEKVIESILHAINIKASTDKRGNINHKTHEFKYVPTSNTWERR